MNIIIRDQNGNTVFHARVSNTEPIAVRGAFLTDDRDLMVGIALDERDPDAAITEYEDEAQAHAERMTADDMRAAPDWSL